MADEEPQEVESSPASEEAQVDESTTETVAEDTASSSDATEVEAEGRKGRRISTK